MRLIVAVFLGSMALAGASAQSPVPSQAGEHDAVRTEVVEHDAALTDAVDKNADPHIVEIDVDARVANVEFAPGQRIDAWTYNGLLPGPLIRANVGDRLIVHFTNSLPQPTTMHWHGLQVPANMDGTPGHSQPEVVPGGRFDYDFILPDAGLYWYHPHVLSAAQVGFGLYGAVLVADPSDHLSMTERVLVLSDIGIEAPGVFERPNSGGSAGMVFGREGNHLLVNGREAPTFIARAGAPERWRIVNSAKSKYFNLDIGSPFLTIGGDGGLQEFPTSSEMLLLAPGERADVIVSPRGAPGTSLTVQALLYDRGYGSVEMRTPFDDLFTIRFTDAAAQPAAPLPAIRHTIEALPRKDATRVPVDLTLTQRLDQEYEFGIDGVPFAKDHLLHAKPGETQIWTVNNKTKWSHPFHIHGFFFQVLDANEQPVHPLAWKDTVSVPYEKSLKLIVRFDADRPGMWMYHCHVLDHADGGMMGMIQVGEPSHTGQDHVMPRPPVH